MPFCGRRNDVDQLGPSQDLSSFRRLGFRETHASLEKNNSLSERMDALEIVPSSSGASSRPFGPSSSGPSSSGASSFLSQVKEARPFDPSHEDDVIFVIYSCQTGHEFRAFDQSGSEMHGFDFTLDVTATDLPLYSGFGVLASTLYMIGGDTFIPTPDSHPRQVSCLDTYMIDLHRINAYGNSTLPQAHFVTRFVEKGPCLNAEKLFPIVVVVQSKIYVFSNYLSPTKSPNFEVLEGEWKGLPEPPFEIPVGGYVKVEYYFVSKLRDSIIVCLSYNECTWVCELVLSCPHWIVLCSGISPSFYGKVIEIDGVGYALDDHPSNHRSRVVHFTDFLSPSVQEVDGLKPSPTIVSFYCLSEIGCMGDTLFHARIGCESMKDCNKSIKRKQDCHITIDRFQICKEAARRKALKFTRKACALKDIGFIFGCRSVSLVTWASGRR